MSIRRFIIRATTDYGEYYMASDGISGYYYWTPDIDNEEISIFSKAEAERLKTQSENFTIPESFYNTIRKEDIEHPAKIITDTISGNIETIKYLDFLVLTYNHTQGIRYIKED